MQKGPSLTICDYCVIIVVEIRARSFSFETVVACKGRNASHWLVREPLNKARTLANVLWNVVSCRVQRALCVQSSS